MDLSAGVEPGTSVEPRARSSLPGETGAVCAEFACGTVAAVACAVMLRLLVISPWFEKNLARPFGLALSALF